MYTSSTGCSTQRPNKGKLTYICSYKFTPLTPLWNFHEKHLMRSSVSTTHRN